MTRSPAWVPVLILFGLLFLAYLGMWWGWRRRGRRHDLPPLVEVPADRPPPVLQAGGRYFGTTTSGSWLDRVVARGLGARSTCRLSLSEDALDVDRTAGSFRIPATALRGARHERGLAGKVVPPHGLLVVSWQHGDLLLDTGFRLTEFALRGRARGVGDEHEAWVRTIAEMATEDV
ncbi:MAG TPA: hypothetical protein VFX52_02160 [Nocardioidaceae bacterium]|nr:hypothetical protein [Nocardioidaceae bacterium]